MSHLLSGPIALKSQRQPSHSTLSGMNQNSSPRQGRNSHWNSRNLHLPRIEDELSTSALPPCEPPLVPHCVQRSFNEIPDVNTPPWFLYLPSLPCFPLVVCSAQAAAPTKAYMRGVKDELIRSTIFCSPSCGLAPSWTAWHETSTSGSERR